MLRTGGLNTLGAFRPGKQSGQHWGTNQRKGGSHSSTGQHGSKAQKSGGHRATAPHIYPDSYPSAEFNQFPIDEMAEMWSDYKAHDQHLDGMEQDEPWKDSHDKNDKEKISSESVKSTENSVSDGSWGHESRFPWKNLPTHMCFRESCERDSDCCLKFNLCDRSAKICVDCWHHSSCITEAQCCEKYPYCKRDPSATDSEPSGRCVKSL